MLCMSIPVCTYNNSSCRVNDKGLMNLKISYIYSRGYHPVPNHPHAELKSAVYY